MRHFARILWPLLATVLVACLTPSSILAAPAPPRAERPTYALGEKWLRDDGAYELVRIEDDRYVFVAGPDQVVELTKDLAVAKVQRGQAVDVWNSPPALTWPLEIGKWGSGSGASTDIVWSVEAYEPVRVPAGTFQAFRVQVVVMNTRSNLASTRTFRLWYAPEVRHYVKGESTGYVGQGTQALYTFQVVAVDRPAPAPLQVVLQELPDQARVTAGHLPLKGKVAGGKGVTRVTVTLNGREVARHDAPPGALPTEVPLDVALPLQEGKNVLLVTATDPEGTTREEARTLVYDPPAAVAGTRTAPAPAGASAGTQPPLPSSPTAPPGGPPRPFQVALTTPKEDARVERESIGLAGLVAGGQGVVRVVVTVNGLEATRLEEKSPQRALPLNLALRLQEGPNTVVVTATEADGTIHQEVRTVHYERRVPLTVAIRYPEDQARLTDATSTITALVTSSKGVAKVTVLVNGVQVHEQTERTAPKSLVVTAPATLREGPNTFVVSASEPDGAVHQEVRTVRYEKPAAATVASPTPPARPANRWAVVVGVGRHDHPQIPRLRYSVPDAEAIHRVLIGPGGFKPEHVLLLTDTSERKPTLRNLKWALGSFLARAAGKDDVVLVFFAGHGAPEVDHRGLERDGLAKYLIPSDADPEDLYSTALPMDELQTIFGRLEAERVVVFLDTCYSGAAGGRTFASARTRAVNVDELFLERLTRAKARAIITASRATEVSLEMAELGHGLFTYYLVQGLEGAADLNRDGIVALQELYEYLEQQVSEKARALGGRQHPVMKGELEGVLPLAKVPAPRP